MNAPTPEIQESNLATAILAVMKEVKRLEKTTENKFGKYMFVNIDDFKDFYRPIMASHDLIPHVDETSFKLLPSEKGAPIAKIKYSITVEHAPTRETSKPARTTVALPFVGAQTTGIAKSYAIKEWIKSSILASAGEQEDDADATGPAPLRLSKQAARDEEKKLRAEMRKTITGGSHEDLAEWWQSRKPRLDSLPQDWFIKIKNDYADEWILLKAQEDLDRASNDDLDAIAQEQS